MLQSSALQQSPGSSNYLQMRRYLYFICLFTAVVFSGCTNNYECRIDEVICDEPISQKGGTVEIPVSFVRTKNSTSGRMQEFRFRAMIDGVEYSYSENVLENQNGDFFTVLIPWNDTYEERAIRIDVSVSDDFEKTVWGEWRTVFTATQLALKEDELRRYSQLDDYYVCVVLESQELRLDLIDNISSRCFKRLLYDKGEITFVAKANQWDIQVSKEELIKASVPVYCYSLNRCEAGDLLVDNEGALSLKCVAHKVQGVNMTYLGRISRSNLVDLNAIRETLPDNVSVERSISFRLVKRSVD